MPDAHANPMSGDNPGRDLVDALTRLLSEACAAGDPSVTVPLKAHRAQAERFLREHMLEVDGWAAEVDGGDGVIWWDYHSSRGEAVRHARMFAGSNPETVGRATGRGRPIYLIYGEIVNLLEEQP